ncbi:hypothetical protein [Streptomyces sp. NPDC054854]
MSTTNPLSCAFCMEPTDVDVFGDGITLDVARAGSRSAQRMWAHINCPDSALHPEMPCGEVLEQWPYG